MYYRVFNTDFIPDNYVIEKLSCYSFFDHDPYVLNCINVYAFHECVARLFDKLKRALTFIFVVVFLSNYFYCVGLNFSEEFDEMLRALSMSNLEHNSRVTDIKHSACGRQPVLLVTFYFCFSCFHIRLPLSVCFYFLCFRSLATQLSIGDNAFDKHGGRLLLAVDFMLS